MAQRRTQKSKKAAEAHPRTRSHLPFSVDGYKKGDVSLPSPYITPTLRYESGTQDKPIICPATELLSLDHLRNPLMIFGQPFSGKTCLFMKLIAQGKAHYGPKHWVHIVDLRMAALRFRHLSTQKWPTNVIEFLAGPLNMSVNAVRDLLKPLGNYKELLRKKKFDKLITGELFLDGFDEIPVVEREYFLKLLPQLRTERQLCPIRIWINCRSYFKERVLEVMGDEGAFEIIEYSPEFQREMLYDRWKDKLFPEKATKYEEKRLWEYTTILYNEFCKDVSNFHTTIGSCPLFLEIISSIFLNHANNFIVLYEKVRRDVLAGASGHDHQNSSAQTETNKTKDSEVANGKGKKKKKKSKGGGKAAADKDDCDVVTAPTAQIMCQLEGMLPGELFEYLMSHAIDIYCLKYHYRKNMTEKEYQTLLEREHRRAIHLYAQYAIRTFPSYQHEALIPAPDNPSVLQPNLKYIVNEDLHHIGLLTTTGRNCLVQYQNKSMGDYFLAKHFSIANNLNVKDTLFDTFFLRVLFFEADAKPVRSLYDSILQFGAGVEKYRPEILHDFLVQHYKLEADDEDQWERIRYDGSCWHVAIMEGFHRTAMVMLECFDPITEREKVRKLLRIKVPIEVHRGEKINPTISRVDGGGYNQRHLMSSMSLIAMFGYNGMEEILKTMLTFFTAEEIQEELSSPGTWTPIHYAAMHSNLWFMMYVYSDAFKMIQPPPGMYNRLGQLPTHLLMSYSWYHILVLRDHFNPDYDTLTGGWPFDSNNKHSSTLSGKPNQEKFVACDHENVEECGCTLQVVQKNFREITYYRNMIKDIQGPGMGILLRLTHHECIRLVIRSGGEDINAAEVKTGNTMMHYAAKQGFLDTVKYLLGLGASIMPTNTEGMTPLHFAGMYGHRYVFMYLVKNYGAKATMKDNQGQSPITLWRLHGSQIDKEKNGAMSTEESHFFQLFIEAEKMKEARRKSQEEAAKRERDAAQRKLEREQENANNDDDDEDEGEDEGSEANESGSSYEENNNNDDVIKENDGDEDEDDESDSALPPYDLDFDADYHSLKE